MKSISIDKNIFNSKINDWSNLQKRKTDPTCIMSQLKHTLDGAYFRKHNFIVINTLQLINISAPPALKEHKRETCQLGG